jgi:hypothetical protein
MKEGFITKLTFIWFALIFGQVLFLCILLFVVQEGGFAPELKGMLEYVAVGSLLPMLLMSQVLYKKQMQKAANSDTSEEDKLAMYQTATIIKGGLMEGGNLFCLVAYLMTGVQWLIVPIVAVLVLFFMQRPSVQKFDFEMGSSTRF